MPVSKTYVADTQKWTDFFMNTATRPLLTNSLHQRGGNLGNGTINNSKIVAVGSPDKKFTQKAPGITIISSAQRDLQQAKSELRRERRIKRGERRENEGTLIILTDESRGGKRCYKVDGFERTL